MSTPPPRSQGAQMPPMEFAPDMQIEYVNLVRIAHSPSEIVFDFAQLLPGTSSAKVTSRIVMSPLGAKLLYRALGENLAKFETAFGEIAIPGGSSLAEYLFRPPDRPSQT